MIAYITYSLGLIVAWVIQDNVISNILLFGNILQTLIITKLAYRLTKNKYGYEVYGDASA